MFEYKVALLLRMSSSGPNCIFNFETYCTPILRCIAIGYLKAIGISLLGTGGKFDILAYILAIPTMDEQSAMMLLLDPKSEAADLSSFPYIDRHFT
jgi:hypothetical protein